jgi:ribosomal protein S3
MTECGGELHRIRKKIGNRIYFDKAQVEAVRDAIRVNGQGCMPA